ncbi:MAG: preprotein translocase subunit YajC [Culicoidibacterales bacterium]
MEAISFLLFPLFLFVMMYFVIIRPNKKQRVVLESFQSNLCAGNKVITTAGIYGEIQSMDDQTITLKMIDGQLIKFRKDAIVRMQTEDVEDKGVIEDENK